jgi:hypothetical protein
MGRQGLIVCSQCTSKHGAGPDRLLVVYRCTQVAAGPDCLLIVYYTGAPKGQQGLAAGPDYLLVVYRCTQGAETLTSKQCNRCTHCTQGAAPGETLNPEKP